MVRFLIEEHYDRKYRVFKKPEIVVEGRSVEEAIGRVREVLREMMDEGEAQDSGLQGEQKALKV